MKSKKGVSGKKGVLEYIKMTKSLKKFLANKEIRLSKKVQVMFILIMMGIYLISPIDVVPDFIPVFGYFEDIIAGISMLAYTGSIIDKQLGRFGETDKIKKQEVIDVEFMDEDEKDPE